MKKILLMSVALSMVVSVSAQKVRSYNPAPKDYVKQVIVNADQATSEKVENNRLFSFAKSSSPRKEVAAFPYESIIMNFIEEDITKSATLTVSEVDMTLQAEDEEGNIVEIPCNVQIENWAGKSNYWTNTTAKPIYGSFDSEEGVLSIPVGQNIMSYDNGNEDEAFDMYLFAYDKDGQSVETITFTEQGEGVYEMDQPLYQVIFTDPTDGKGYYWYQGEEGRFLVANGLQAFYTSGKAFQTEAPEEGTSYGYGEMPVNIEDFGVMFNINNYFGRDDLKTGSQITIEIKDDGETCKLPMLTTIYYHDYSDDDFEYGYMHTQAENEGYADNTMEYIEGKFDGSVFDFSDKYFTIATNWDSEGSGYGMGWFTGLMIGYVNNEEPTGIVEASSLRKNIVKNTTIYNMMGQKVDRRHMNGIMLINGKKYIAK